MNPTKPSPRAHVESLPTWALVALCAAYVAWPLDALPLCPIDDLVVFGWTLWTIVKRVASGRRTPPPGPQFDAPVHGHVVASV